MKPHSIFTRPGVTVARAVTLSTLVALCVAGMPPGAAQSPEKEEREVQDKIPAHVPIKIKLKKPEKVKDLGNDRWLADLEIEVKNTGTKPIYFLEFFMDFDDVKRDSGARIGYGFTYGRDRLILVVDEKAKPEDVPIEPGGTHVFTLHPDYVEGWDWYRTRVEQKPHPKKVSFRLSTLSFGDGTGYVTNAAVFVPQPPKPRSSYEQKPGKRWAVTADVGYRPARPPSPSSQLLSSFLPASLLPVNFSPAGRGAASTAATLFQTCCPNEPCERMMAAPGGNCFCPLDNPEDGRHIELDSNSCNTAGFVCATAIYAYTDCGSGVTYRTCVKVSLDFLCGEEPPPPPPPPCPSPKVMDAWGNCVCPPNSQTQQDCEQVTQVWCDRLCRCSTDTQCASSPVLVDVEGDGLRLTGADRGVLFDLDSDGAPERLSWTSPASDDAWLALDRDGDGSIGSGRELFGNFTPQPAPPEGEEQNGFLALAVYDRAARGGNGDGVIDRRDSVFASLRLWRDANHNGVSEATELRRLSDSGLESVDLDYKESRRVDASGNRFKYRAKVTDARGAQLGRWAWDVFLVSAP